MSIEAMKQALEALTIAQDSCIHGEMAEPSPIFDEAITALRTAIEQAEQAQPVDQTIWKLSYVRDAIDRARGEG